MKRVLQEFMHDPANDIVGDCQRAVIASLLDLELKDVPHFGQLSGDSSEKFWELIQEFVKQYGYQYLTVNATGSGISFFGSDEKIYHEIAGPSPRFTDTLHAVVACNGEIVWDPHPEHTGLAGTPDDWTYSYLVKL